MRYFESGISKAKRGDYEDAIADFDRGIELEPQDNRLYLAKGFFAAKLQGNKGKKDDHMKNSSLLSSSDRE